MSIRSSVLMLAMLSAWMACPACAHVPVVRDASTYTVETLAEISRQEKAADHLLDAARYAAVNGDTDRCTTWATTALLIQAKARAQGYRSLWLAGLPYPVDGKLPATSKGQPDPGVAPEPADAATVCNLDTE